jgi:hypothetical protein
MPTLYKKMLNEKRQKLVRIRHFFSLLDLGLGNFNLSPSQILAVPRPAIPTKAAVLNTSWLLIAQPAAQTGIFASPHNAHMVLLYSILYKEGGEQI